MTNSAPGALQPSIAFAYDPLMRLAVIDSTNAGFDVQFGYDGQEMVFEGLSAGRTRRYVHGPGVDEPLVGYLITSTGTSRLWYQADERGSIARLSNDAGTPGSIGKFDEYGVGGISRFRYTGQYWLGDGNLLYSRARIYDAKLGRFLQPDPIGYGDGMNMYAYVGGDPINSTDPTGTSSYSANRAEWVDNEEEWSGHKGVNLIALAGGHSRDGMGTSDLVRMAGGRVEASGYDRYQGAVMRLNRISADTGVSVRCLLRCTDAAVYLASAQYGGGGGSDAGWGREFAAVRDHWARHGERLGTRSVGEYLRQAEKNVDEGRSFRFRVDGQQRMAHLTRIMEGVYMFTSTNLAETRIYTHMRVTPSYLGNIGITLPRGF